MRPSAFTDGNAGAECQVALGKLASMRPSAFTDGNCALRLARSSILSAGFNEAVGFHRRKRRRTRHAWRGNHRTASMRPSAFTDGNLRRTACTRSTRNWSFNEAVGFHRRKRARCPTGLPRAKGFNEAVGFHRRKRTAPNSPQSSGLPTELREVRCKSANSISLLDISEAIVSHKSLYVKELDHVRALPGRCSALERSARGGESDHMITGSRFITWNGFPRLTTRGSTLSATPRSTSTT